MDGIVKLNFLALLIILSTTVSAQQDSIVYQNWKRDPNTDIDNTVSNQKQIITKDQILLSGYTLLSDVFRLIDGWSISTWNGDRWNMQSNGSGTYQMQSWKLLLNGQRIDLMRLDAQHINSLGISVFDIDRIEILNVVGNYLGEFNENGIIHIITKKNKEGLTYRGIISNGNEIGDPHLNTINDLHSNVHEYGVSMGNHIGFRKNKWNFEINQYLNSYFYRDTSTLMYPTVRKYNPGAEAYNTLLSGKLSLTYTSSKITHQFTGMINRSDDVVLPAGIFNPVTGKHDYNTVGYNMRYASPRGIWQYRGSLTDRSFIGTIQNQLSHEQLNQTHNLNFTTYKYNRKGSSVRQLGLAYDQISTRVLDSISSHTTTDFLIRPYLSYNHPLSKRSNLFTDISVATNTQYLLPKFVLGYYKHPSVIVNWSFVASYSQRSQMENNSYLYLYSMIDSNSLSVSDEVSSLTTFDYYFNINVSKHFKLSFNSGLKYLENELLFTPTSIVNASSPLLLRTEISDVQQTRWLNRINIHYGMLKNTEVDINYLYTSLLNDEWTTQNNIPKHRFSATVSHNLPLRFYIWSRYCYQSSTYWINPLLLANPNTLSTELYSKLNPTHTWDIGVTKKLLKDYLVTNLSVRNVLNTTERYQANGASFYLRIFLSIRLNIEGLFAKSPSKP